MIKKYSDRLKSYFVWQAVFFVILVAVDQLIKYWVVQTLKGKDAVVLIKDVLEFQYLENRGASFGILENKQWLFYIITAIVIIAIIFIVVRIYKKLRDYLAKSLEDDSIFRQKSVKDALYLSFVFILLAGGAIGNFIDRVLNGYVVDYIYFKIINFPIFNFADICVTVAAVLLIVFFIFTYKEDDNLAIFGKSKK